MISVHCFQAKVGSFLGFGSELNITRQIVNTVFSKMAGSHPEVQVGTRLDCRNFYIMDYCDTNLCLESFTSSLSSREDRHRMHLFRTVNSELDQALQNCLSFMD